MCLVFLVGEFMKILVYNPAASYGGAFSILQDFLKDILEDEENKYYFLVTTKNKLDNISKNKKNIEIINIDNYKSSLLSRFYWDQFGILNFIKSYEIDYIISLQNTCNLLIKKTPQLVYLHQSKPFFIKKYKDLFSTKDILITYLRDFYMRISSKKASGIIVQSDWFKKAVSDRYKISENKIFVIEPKLEKFNVKENEVEFNIKRLVNSIKLQKNYLGIYVASPSVYKNFEVLLNFVCNYNNNHSRKVYLILTIKGNENKYAAKIYSLTKTLNIENYIHFLGRQNRSTIHYLYENADALFFPSIIETYGLPLKEAMNYDIKIFAANLAYAKSVCDDSAFYFNPFDSNDLEKIFKENMDKKIERKLLNNFKEKSYLEIIRIFDNLTDIQK